MKTENLGLKIDPDACITEFPLGNWSANLQRSNTTDLA